MWESIKQSVGKLFKEHPWLWPVVMLLCTVVNLYAHHIHSETSPITSFFDLTFAILASVSPVGAVIPAPTNVTDSTNVGEALSVTSTAAQRVTGKVWYAQY